MTDKEKILQFLTNNGISQNSFYRKTGFSQGFLKSGNSIGVDKLKRIIEVYPEFNYKSLLFENEYKPYEKLNKVAEKRANYSKKEIDKIASTVSKSLQPMFKELNDSIEGMKSVIESKTK